MVFQQVFVGVLSLCDKDMPGLAAGCGKTTWAKKVMAEDPGKQYVLLSAATALQQMRVSEAPPQTCGCAIMLASKHGIHAMHQHTGLRLHWVAAKPLWFKQCPPPDGKSIMDL